jgi:hypothetical protein
LPQVVNSLRQTFFILEVLPMATTNPWINLLGAVVSGIANAATQKSSTTTPVQTATKTATTPTTSAWETTGSQYANSSDAAVRAAYNSGGFQGVSNLAQSSGNTALYNESQAARDQKLASAAAPITWTAGGQTYQAVPTSTSKSGSAVVSPTPVSSAVPKAAAATAGSAVPAAAAAAASNAAASGATTSNIQKIANVNTVIPGTDKYTPGGYTAAQLSVLFPENTPQAYLDAYNTGGYQGVINISDTGFWYNPGVDDRNTALSILNSARNDVISGSAAPITWTDADGNQRYAIENLLSYIGGGLTPGASSALVGSTPANVYDTSYRYDPAVGLQNVGNASANSNTIRAQDPAVAAYNDLLSGNFGTSNPGLQQGVYTFPYQYGGANATDPVGNSNALEQQTGDVVNFNDDAAAQLYASPEYQALMKNDYLAALKLYNNIKGAQSGSTGVAGSNTNSAIAQGLNQLYGEVYDNIPTILQNLYGREVTGLDAIRQYENDAWTKGVDQRDYDTNYFQWLYAQNKDNFLTDRNFQYLLNRDWIDDARYADETAWNRAMAERQQAFTEWASTYRNADGSPLSAAQYEQAQQAFDNEMSLAYLQLQQSNAAKSGSSGGGGGSGDNGGGLTDNTAPATPTPGSTDNTSGDLDAYDNVVGAIMALLEYMPINQFGREAAAITKKALADKKITQSQYNDLVSDFKLGDYL